MKPRTVRAWSLRLAGPELRNREIYIDAFRGLMALVMVQGHLFDTLLTATARAHPLYQFQVTFHGSTAPGFLFASGFVVGLPRAPLSFTAGLRRARRILFVLGVGYALQLPYLSLAKVLAGTPREWAAATACNALQVIAVSQLLVLFLQWVFGRRWTTVAGLLALVVMALGPSIWASGVAGRMPLLFGAFLDAASGSFFPVFPFSTFVLAGTVAGAILGRQEPKKRRWRACSWSGGLVLCGVALAFLTAGRLDFWSISPAYTFLRLGGLILLLIAVEIAARREWPGIGALARLGHETLLVYVLHLAFLYGWIFGPAPLGPWIGRMGFGGAGLSILGMLPILFGAAWLWHRVKARAPRASFLLLAFLTTAVAFDFVTRPW